MIVKQEKIDSIEGLFSKLNSYDSGYMFRGQRDSTWQLKNGIERLFPEKYDLPEPSVLRSYESRMLKKFKSIAHLYGDFPQLPQDDSKLGWLALMQHHGAPTRLVDFTTMPFMGLYFAIDGASAYSKGFSSIYAVSFRKINSITIEQLAQNVGIDHAILKNQISADPDKFFHDYIDRSSYPLLWCIEPLRLNLRLRQQGGTFMTANEISRKFQDAIDGYSIYKDIQVDKIDIPHSMIPDISIMLTKMGITNKQIYPGLDGLSKDISQEMVNYITIATQKIGLEP